MTLPDGRRDRTGVWSRSRPRYGTAAGDDSGKPEHLILMIAEVKEIVPSSNGFKAVMKHVPIQAFALDEQRCRPPGQALRP